MVHEIDSGVLAVTRAIGNTKLKEWVIGKPFTTEVVITEEDKFLVLASDGVFFN